MNPSVFDYIMEKRRNIPRVYAAEQTILSDAFRNQFKDEQQCLDEIRKFGYFGKYNYSDLNMFTNERTGPPVLSQHWGTRGVQNVLNIAESLDVEGPVPEYIEF